MDTPTWSVGRSCVRAEVRAELARLGLAKEDFERHGVDADGLAREVLRQVIAGRRGKVAAVLGEILDRIGLTPGDATASRPSEPLPSALPMRAHES